ncbi:LptF/LptG family permease [Tenacibaculum finnmarkense]|uniref:Permease n=1 Tax=Tenacibaculum finnmarkense genomovar ulcerans TaxID=2781388 RepID=A0A2I2MAY7_9FLAO|nr:LptF/LptG family permease [Tenacibaculum finnmarkense]MBE7697740.1 LptF/LptG family permease [Tenacibaculum finnmarkense genomovar ulcerans]MCD8399947.1 LptF/LptG family permease [Tenacibaculum finnmarkense genomovar ulcerans]MCD8444148.1 LptF/LptG family permease [Tenacibaculum finnmarkense genomovar ulcerans]MCG8236389.1 LptF/LptG family permease [Tenacibaculum finnmarkense genomovar ulcerans]MCG8733695.1 YjgP/YjgQ family permease [Tenacibaculum finnmarkense]
MKILDWYILKRFLATFLFTLLILIPIAVAIDIAEKIDKFLREETLTFFEVVNDYYVNFIIYYANTFMPLALFIAVILFTSKLANNTEIVAINGSQVSFTRFLYPYFIGATIVCSVALLMNHFFVPSSSKTRKKFERTYLKKRKYSDHTIREFSLQLNDSTYIYLQSFDLKRNTGYNFTTEIYDGIQLKQQLSADNINWSEKDSTFKLYNWKLRKIFKARDSIFSGNNVDTTFAFTPKDFNYKNVMAQEMRTPELIKFIEMSKDRGIKNLNMYLVELYKRTSLPIACYILTLIAVGLAYKKTRGGIGANLALGISLMFLYVFFLKVAEVLGAVAGANALLNVWIPNIVFGLYSLYLYLNGRK